MRPTDSFLVGLTRHLRSERPEVRDIFRRIGFRDYMTRDEITFLHTTLPCISKAFSDDKVQGGDGHQDEFITLGLLARLADSILCDDDLEGDWVAAFINDRRKVPAVGVEGRRQAGGTWPVELGWTMAVAREIDADSTCWNYFENLSDIQHHNPRERPKDNPIELKIAQFRDKHCLANRDHNLGVYPLLYAKLNGETDDITNVEQAREVLKTWHATTPKVTGGINLDIYFEDLNR